MKIAALFVSAALCGACVASPDNRGGVDGAGLAPAYASDAVAFDAEGRLGSRINPFEVDDQWPFASLGHRGEVGVFGGEAGAFVDEVEVDGATWYAWMPATQIGPEVDNTGYISW